MAAEVGNEREDMAWLLPLDDRKNNSTQPIDSEPDSGPVMHKLCNRCLSMFSSLDGLRALVSTRGYQHYDKEGLEGSADKGCPVCLLFLGSIKSSSEFLGQLYFKANLYEEDCDYEDSDDQAYLDDQEDWEDEADWGENISSAAYPDRILKMFSVTTRLGFGHRSEEKTFAFYRLAGNSLSKANRQHIDNLLRR
jgi:hypothetical protein